MADKLPSTALELVWKVVRDARWNGNVERSPGFVANVLSCYVGFAVLFVERLGKGALRVQIEERWTDQFRNAFPDATLDVRYSPTRGTVMMRLPIPEHERSPE